MRMVVWLNPDHASHMGLTHGRWGWQSNYKLSHTHSKKSDILLTHLSDIEPKLDSTSDPMLDLTLDSKLDPTSDPTFESKVGSNMRWNVGSCLGSNMESNLGSKLGSNIGFNAGPSIGLMMHSNVMRFLSAWQFCCYIIWCRECIIPCFPYTRSSTCFLPTRFRNHRLGTTVQQ